MRDSVQVNVWCGLMRDRVIRPFLSDPTVIRASYLNMLELYVLSQFPPATLLQQDGPPPYYSHIVRNCPSHDAWRIDRQRGAICLASSVTKLKTFRFFPVSYVKNLAYQVKNNCRQ